MTRQSSKPPAAPTKKAVRKTVRTASSPVAELAQPSAAADPVATSPEPDARTVPESERIPDVPNIYADAVLDVVFGVYTSKILLGFETGNSNVRPVSVVTLPTEALVTACMKVLENVGAPGTGRQIVARHANFARTLQHLAASFEDAELDQKH